MAFRVPEQYRITTGRLGSTAAFGCNGAFQIPVRVDGEELVVRVIASDQEGWEHVSASFHDRTPPWAVMCMLKELFWSADDCVVQYHPPKADYVNFHPFCLHLWRPIGVELPRPPTYMVGPVTART